MGWRRGYRRASYHGRGGIRSAGRGARARRPSVARHRADRARPDRARPDRVPGSATAEPSQLGPGFGDSPGPGILDTLLPVAGQPRLRALPSALSGQPGYERAVVIACPSNDTGDQASEVTYETRSRFTQLSATLRPYREPADGVKADLFVFEDNADRKPGGPPGTKPTQVRVIMGDAGIVSASIGNAYYLRLRVVCEKPGGFMILAGARLLD